MAPTEPVVDDVVPMGDGRTHPQWSTRTEAWSVIGKKFSDSDGGNR
jgi:hypothetical protein